MKESLLHLPVDFEMRSDVRRLVFICRNEGGDELARLATLFWMRLWTEWAREGVEWRPLDGRVHDDAGAPAWEAEPITVILEEYCGWRGRRGGLLDLSLQAGVLAVETRGNLRGLVLRDFWRYNAHLSPDYRSFQAKGGLTKAANRGIKQLEAMAGQQRRLLQTDLMFPEAKKTTEAEQNTAIALVLRIDRACGGTVRATAEYSPALLECAVEVIRAHGNEAITTVERYLHRHRANVEVVKVPERVIGEFDEYLRRAKSHE